MLRQRVPEMLFGVLFGALLGGMYAFTTQAINWVFMPGIPLLPPAGSLSKYLFEYTLMGALLGLVTAAPTERFTGMAVGGFFAETLNVMTHLTNAWGTEVFDRSLVTLLYTFLPMVVLMMPLSLIIRLCVDAQDVDAARPYLWPRRFLIPAGVLLVIVLVGALSLHSPDVRNGFEYTNRMLQQGLTAARTDALPLPLQEVRNFAQEARGPYILSYSDKVDTFMGPVPAGAELSQFLIIAYFQNGFSMACVFSSNRSTPNCTNY